MDPYTKVTMSPRRAAHALVFALFAAVLVPKAPAQEAEELVPFEKLDVELRKELWKVSKKFTVRRKVDEQKIACSSDTYEWLLLHLPLASVAARELDLGKYVIEDRGDRKFSIDDADGAFATCERIFEERPQDAPRAETANVGSSTPGRVVVVARGTVESDVIPKTPGTGVIVVRWKSEPDDRKHVLTEAFVFFRVTSESLHLVSGPFRDKLGGIVGAKLESLVACAGKVSAEVEKDPARVLAALERSKKVKDAELAEFKRKFILE
jgi:hypothetical protein